MKIHIIIIVIILIILCIGIIFIMQDKQESTNNVSKQQKVIDLEKISLKIEENSIKNTGLVLIITDNNEKEFSWNDGYEIQKKVNGKWIELEPKNELVTTAFPYHKDENNQYIQKINWEYYYGILENGQYRIVKPLYVSGNNGRINLYSEEFEINEQ